MTKTINGRDVYMVQDELVYIACKMSQELRDFCDAAEESGSPLPCTEDLLKEWDENYKQFSRLGGG